LRNASVKLLYVVMMTAARVSTVHDQRAVVGVDLGTSGVKVLVASLDTSSLDTSSLDNANLDNAVLDNAVRDNGSLDSAVRDSAVLGRGRAEYPVLVPAFGRAESDPGDWWRATCRAVRQAVAQAREAEIVGVAVAGQMHGLVLAGEGTVAGDGAFAGHAAGGADVGLLGDVVRPAILWLDQRAAVEADRYAELPAALTSVLGNRPSAGMAGPILGWLAEHEPGNLAAARWALQPKDWIRLRMTGQAATDPTDASGTLLFDLEREAWADDLIAALGLPRRKLPPVLSSALVAGVLLAGPAAALGLPPGIPVAAGAADTAAALYAAGLRDDEAMLTLGSGGQWAVLEREFRPTSTTNLYRAVGDGYYRLAPVQNVGVTLDWVRTLLNVSWADLYDAAARPARPDAPVFAPYLTPERWDPAATGAWTGLALAHQREDLLRSALDGVAALLRERLDDLRAAGHDPSSVILGGGGAIHPAWRDLLAAALGVPLRPAPAAWLTATGAARLAAAASYHF
jgi:xylulokinase